MTAYLTRPIGHTHALTSTGIDFKNPFESNQDRYSSSTNEPYATQNLRSQSTRSFDPLPDTTEMFPSIPAISTVRDQNTASGNVATNNAHQRATYKVANTIPDADVSGHASLRRNTAAATTISPISNDRLSYDGSQSESRRTSVVSNIAPSFQIPRTINDSGGSLSELAAEMIENSKDLSSVVARPLLTDARPSTGFRKWVTTILSTTLVAQNVVLLALLFVFRLKKLNPNVQGKPGSEYRLLTIALMLGNKFLDDNTYTNKTWAEVSGINVSEVHVMEVEFLSNMKYSLYTSAEDWTRWQSLLGRFASYVEKSKNPPPQITTAPHLSSTWGFPYGFSPPSPPASAQASPPYVGETVHGGSLQSHVIFNGATPAPSPHVAQPDSRSNRSAPRKRSLDDSGADVPVKRLTPYSNDPSPRRAMAATLNRQNLARLPPPNLASSMSNVPSLAAHSQGQQLPPMNVLHPIRIPPFAPLEISQVPAPMAGQYSSRQQSPYLDSRTASPTVGEPRSATSLHPPIQISPNYFLQQRSSPYRPIRHVSTLLYPPPSTALQQRGQNVEQSQMHYQPLGKTVQHQQTGHLPYVSQNVWVDGSYPQAMTPVHQWPSFGHAFARHHFTKQ